MSESTDGGFLCAGCGERAMVLVNTRCIACATEVTPAHASWVCARCGISNAPHVDACACKLDPIVPVTIGDYNVDLIDRAGKLQILPFEDDQTACGTCGGIDCLGTCRNYAL